MNDTNRTINTWGALIAAAVVLLGAGVYIGRAEIQASSMQDAIKELKESQLQMAKFIQVFAQGGQRYNSDDALEQWHQSRSNFYEMGPQSFWLEKPFHMPDNASPN
ncbi:MAG: hypothetical protein AAGJ81_14785 [Verrucomicrobiota bacterium]